jgi:hypothetical protein
MQVVQVELFLLFETESARFILKTFSNNVCYASCKQWLSKNAVPGTVTGTVIAGSRSARMNQSPWSTLEGFRIHNRLHRIQEFRMIDWFLRLLQAVWRLFRVLFGMTLPQGRVGWYDESANSRAKPQIAKRRQRLLRTLMNWWIHIINVCPKPTE